MDAATQDRWNAWAKAIADQAAADSLQVAASVTGKVLRGIITDIKASNEQRDTRIAELEKRLASVEALLAKAKGTTQ